jgi:hypothetical protein
MNDLHTAIEATSSTLEPLLKQYVDFPYTTPLTCIVLICFSYSQKSLDNV